MIHLSSVFRMTPWDPADSDGFIEELNDKVSDILNKMDDTNWSNWRKKYFAVYRTLNPSNSFNEIVYFVAKRDPGENCDDMDVAIGLLHSKVMVVGHFGSLYGKLYYQFCPMMKNVE